MKATINLKKIAKEEIAFFKSLPNIHAPNLQISNKSISLLRDFCEIFARNLTAEALKDVDINSRLLPIHLNKVLGKRLDLNNIDKLIPKVKNCQK